MIKQRLDIPILGELTLSQKIQLGFSIATFFKDLFDGDPERKAARQRRREVRRAEKADRKFREEIEDARERYQKWYSKKEITLEFFQRAIEDLKDGEIWYHQPPTE